MSSNCQEFKIGKLTVKLHNNDHPKNTFQKGKERDYQYHNYNNWERKDRVNSYRQREQDKINNDFTKPNYEKRKKSNSLSKYAKEKVAYSKPDIKRSHSNQKTKHNHHSKSPRSYPKKVKESKKKDKNKDSRNSKHESHHHHQKSRHSHEKKEKKNKKRSRSRSDSISSNSSRSHSVHESKKKYPNDPKYDSHNQNLSTHYPSNNNYHYSNNYQYNQQNLNYYQDSIDDKYIQYPPQQGMRNLSTNLPLPEKEPSNTLLISDLGPDINKDILEDIFREKCLDCHTSMPDNIIQVPDLRIAYVIFPSISVCMHVYESLQGRILINGNFYILSYTPNLQQNASKESVTYVTHLTDSNAFTTSMETIVHEDWFCEYVWKIHIT